MEENNTTILDFISSTVADQLKRLNTEVNKEVAEIDLEKIKNELSNKISSLFNVQEKPKEENNKLIDEFADIFNVDFGNNKKDEKIQRHLLDLLKNKDEAFEDKEFEMIAKAASDNQEEIKENETIKKVVGEDDKLDDIFNEIVNSENGKEENNNELEISIDDAIAPLPKEETKVEETVEPVKKEIEFHLNDYKEVNADLVVNNLITIIEKNRGREPYVVKYKKFAPKEEYKPNEEALDDLLGIIDLINEEKELIIKPKINNNIEFINENDVVNNLLDIVGPLDDLKANRKSFEQLNQSTINPTINNNIKAIEENDVVNNLLDIVGPLDDLKVTETKHNNSFTINPTINNNIESIDSNEVVDNLQEIIGDVKPIQVEEKSDSTLITDGIITDDRPIEQIFIQNPGSDYVDEDEEQFRKDLINELKEAVKEPEEVQKIDDSEYLRELLKELEESDVKENIEEVFEEEESEKDKTYDLIKAIYPSLDEIFIKSMYDQKAQLAFDYPEDKRIVILHRVKFKDVEELRRFVEVIMEHNYVVNVDENKMIVDVIKGYVNKDGLILTEVFEVANQARMLDGEYEGYRVILEEE